MLKFIGLSLVVICGCASGAAAAKGFEYELYACETADEMIRQLTILMEYQSPTVAQMMKSIKTSGENIPYFVKTLPENARREDILRSIGENCDGYKEGDLQKLCGLFSALGSADKSCELARLGSAHLYFSSRVKELSVATGKRVKLAKSLGVLGGILLAVLLI